MNTDGRTEVLKVSTINEPSGNLPPAAHVSCDTCKGFWDNFVSTVRANFPALELHFEVALSVCGVLGIKLPRKPIAVVFEGLPGPGKTLALSCIDGVSGKAKERIYRSDKFSTASFVSQAASVNRATLARVDLLPRIRHKVLNTPELGPMFRGKKESLEETFAILARVMDGRGLTTDSGTHGRRGYTGEYSFCWLGATTYLSSIAFEVMSNVGNRILFFDVSPPRPTIQELARLAQRGGSNESELACTAACDRLLTHFFSAHTIDSPTSVECGLLERPRLRDREANYIAVAARAISRLRCREEGREEFEFRIVEQLALLAAGRAVIEGRSTVLPAHLRILQHLAFSAAKPDLRPILNALLNGPSEFGLTTSEVESLCACSTATALRRMEELAKTKVCRFHVGRAPNTLSRVELSEEYLVLAELDDEPEGIV